MENEKKTLVVSKRKVQCQYCNTTTHPSGMASHLRNKHPEKELYENDESELDGTASCEELSDIEGFSAEIEIQQLGQRLCVTIYRMVCAIVNCADALSVYALCLLCLMLAARQLSLGGDSYDQAFDTVVAKVARHNPVVHSALEKGQQEWEQNNDVYKSVCYNRWSEAFIVELKQEICPETLGSDSNATPKSDTAATRPAQYESWARELCYQIQRDNQVCVQITTEAVKAKN